MDSERLIAAKERAVRAWEDRSARAYLTDWQATTTPEGTLLLSARVGGFDRNSALKAFADDFALPIGDSQRPAFDYSAPGRVQCEWRDSGVWVQLWHPDTALPTPAVLAACPKPQHPMAVAATPSGRLRFRRNRKTERAAPGVPRRGMPS